ncbi:tRNA 5-methylaminomethyl-2-thiouridine biosynthesis bifunctional protein MnmC [Vibrio thalassae]|uniref:tRNA 5-methylaminomethyl-2-thiouridine biosynthesis bifunctional protein MnmC n=1 Tax=Vibrio thalassae TaxID=1243014 RepID=A0A240ENW7_9VIBR|nr:FAD-dependent oxidoreductase [Vibrio thalassae]SNX50316.1 tRNA 5-methylaminomethyl-2-thiouridine biosynthesis bifunctional protein MnmC [Vibrio thalassae]
MKKDLAVATSGKRVAIIGGGVAGSTVALYLAKQGLNVALFEKNSSLVSGPPICHLHAGGNLYRELSQQQCLDLLVQSIDFVKFFPATVNKRPTVIAIPNNDNGTPESLLPRLELLQKSYQSLVEADSANEVLGDPADYFHEYYYEQLKTLALLEVPRKPSSIDEWLIPFAKHTDLSKLKYPVYVVQEYGLSLFRVAASVELAALKLANLDIKTGHCIKHVSRVGEGYTLQFENGHEDNFDFVINACGFRTGVIDDQLHLARERLVEFKAAYVTQWQSYKNEKWPEVIFHGKRGTPQGMAQLTPYPGGYFQLHGMTMNITLFDEGLVQSTSKSAQPQLPSNLIAKVDKGWSLEVQTQRACNAIQHLSQFIPCFETAEPAGTPLYGAQQIPGNDPSLRAADVSFEGEHYARLEIVKASSALLAGKKIAKQWFDLKDSTLNQTESTKEEVRAIESLAKQIAVSRGYPEELAIAY